MMSLIPFRNHGLTNFEPFFDSFMKPFFNDGFFSNDMRIDISENEKEYVLKAELPGVDQKDIDILVRDNVLTITAKRNEEKNEQRGNYIRKERFSGTVTRSFSVDGIDDSRIEASFDKGVLTLTLPKLEESKPSYRRIELK